MTLFDPLCNFSMKGLYLLEHAMGIPILSELVAKQSAFLRIIQVKQSSSIEEALNRWLTNGIKSQIKPSWKNLMHVLCLIELDTLTSDISEVLKGSFNTERFQKEAQGRYVAADNSLVESDAISTSAETHDIISYPTNRKHGYLAIANISYSSSPSKVEINVIIVKDDDYYVSYTCYSYTHSSTCRLYSQLLYIQSL